MLRFLLLFFPLVLTACGQEQVPSNPLVGTWTPVELPADAPPCEGGAAVVEYRPDGTFSARSGRQEATSTYSLRP
ncbi:MAG: hypothetical protein AAFQ43_02545, partial [Bacteroidota bacterium]